MTKIIVAGGGAAGWMTALYMKQKYPTFDICVVASEEIGILGAGESTTPMLLDFFEIVKIPLAEVISETGATIKVSAKFSGWNKENTYYYNPFAADKGLSILDLANIHNTSEAFVQYSIGKDTNRDFDFNIKLSENNLFPFTEDFSRIANFSLNFDAVLMAKYLKNIAINHRNIKYVDDIIISAKTHDNGNIKSILTKNNGEIDLDFIFDCTGFNRLFIGKHFESNWISYKEHLPADKAFPFFLSHDQIKDGVVPYTNAVAMKYGWMWMTPLQHRYGCGYVFDSRYITVEEAKKEVEEYFGFSVNPPKPGLYFEFNPGRYENAWVKNCIGIGLSVSFIEPMEATAILSGLHALKNLPEDFYLPSSNYRDLFNYRYAMDQQEIVDFIYLHYVCTRNDTDFWSNFLNNNKIPYSLKSKLDKSKNEVLTYADFKDTKIFGLENYLYVMEGNGILDTNLYRNISDKKYNSYDYELLKINQNNMIRHAVDWERVLLMIGESNANNK